MDPARKHTGDDNRQKSADDRSNKKYLKLIQMITLFVVINQIVIILDSTGRQHQVSS